MSKHTPGPWRFSKEPDAKHSPCVGFTIYDAGSVVVAEIYPKPYPVAVNEINARLIAAAPELLAALHIASQALAGALCQDLDHDDAQDAMQSVRAAIAKAEGRTK